MYVFTQIQRHSLLLLSTLDTVIDLVQRRQLSTLLEKDPALEPPRKSLRSLILDEFTSWNRKDVVEFFQGTLFRLWNEQEDHAERNDVETTNGNVNKPDHNADCCWDRNLRVEAKGTRLAKLLENGREGDGEYRGPEEAGRHGPTHAHFTVR